MNKAIDKIYQEMVERVAEFESKGKLLEAQRIKERTMNDIEMLRETGFCKGIENYSAVMSGRKPGQAPFTLIDYMPDDFLLFAMKATLCFRRSGDVCRGSSKKGKPHRIWL